MLVLSERPHPRELAGFRQAALDRLDAGEPLRVDAAAVAALPLAWAQMLISASLAARQRGLALGVVNPSFGFLFSFEAIGLQAEPDLFTLEYAP